MSAEDEAEADRLVASATENAQFNAFMRSTFPPTGPVAPAGSVPAQPSPARPAVPVDLHQGARGSAAPGEDEQFAAWMRDSFGVG